MAELPHSAAHRAADGPAAPQPGKVGPGALTPATQQPCGLSGGRRGNAQQQIPWLQGNSQLARGGSNDLSVDLRGESPVKIAKALGISRTSLYRYLGRRLRTSDLADYGCQPVADTSRSLLLPESSGRVVQSSGGRVGPQPLKIDVGSTLTGTAIHRAEAGGVIVTR